MPRTRAWRQAQARLSAPERARSRPPAFAAALGSPDRTVLDLVDNLLNRGVLLNGELILALADVDLVYVRVSLLLAAADRVLGPNRAARRRRSAQAGRPPGHR